MLQKNNCCFKKTDRLTYFGVIIDHRLNWSQHNTHVKNKVSKGIGIMYRARYYLTKSSFKKIILFINISLFNILY